MGQRIKDVISQQTTFNPNLKMLVDHDSFVLTSKAMALGLLGNAYFQGSADGITYHDILLITDTFFRMSTNAGVTWINLTTDLITATAENMYLSAAILAEIQAATTDKHTHSNSTLLASLIDSGDGNSFLANDGTYKPAMVQSVYDTDDDGVVDNSEQLNGQAPSYYLDRTNHIGTIRDSKGLTIRFPTDSENMTLFYTDVSITMLEIKGVVKGTTPSMRIEIVHTTDVSLSGTSIVLPVDVTNTTTGQVLSLNDATIPAESWVVFKTSVKSGTVDEICINMSYDID